MRADYSKQGPASEVLRIGDLPTPQPGPGEVRVKLRTSGVNPSDWKVRRGGFGRGLIAPLIIPHSDGAGDIDPSVQEFPIGLVSARMGVERTMEAPTRNGSGIHSPPDCPGGPSAG